MQTAAPTSTWFSIRMEADEANLSIHDEIGSGGVSAQSFLAQLANIPKSTRTIHISINSPGGSIYDSLAMLTALQRHPARKVVTIEGLAASAASLFIAAGEVHMGENSFLMIHKASASSHGNEKDLRKLADRLSAIEEQVLTIYQRKTGLDRQRLAEMLAEETWLSAEEAKALGFVDYISAGVEVAALSRHSQRFPRLKAPSNRNNLKQIQSVVNMLDSLVDKLSPDSTAPLAFPNSEARDKAYMEAFSADKELNHGYRFCDLASLNEFGVELATTFEAYYGTPQEWSQSGGRKRTTKEILATLPAY